MPANPDNQIPGLIARCEASFLSKNYEDVIATCRTILSTSPDHQRAKELLEEAQSKLEADLFVRDNLRKAQDAFEARDYARCLNECQKIQLLDPDNRSVTDMMAKAQEKMEAEPFIQNFINSGQSLYDSGLYSEAVAQWDKVRSIDPMYPGLDDLISRAREKGGIPASAPPSQPAAFQFDIGDQEQKPEVTHEQDTYNFGFQSDQDKISRLLKEGDDLNRAGKYQKAIEVWSEIFMLDVNHPEALGKIEEARAALSDQRTASHDVMKQAVDAYEKGEQEKARELFQRVMASDPDNSEASRYLGMIESADESPATLQELIARGDSANANAQYREAAQFYSQALAADPDNADLADKIRDLNVLAKKQEQGRAVLGNARAFMAEGKLESARHALSKILEADPSNDEAIAMMREIKGMMGQNATTQEARSPLPSSARQPAAKAKAPSIPVVPAAIGAGVLVLGGLVYFMFFRSPAVDESTQPIRITKKAAPTNAGSTSATPAPATPTVTPAMQAAANELVKEANFYFSEKHYPEAMQKAEEALKNDPDNKDALSIKMEATKVMEGARMAERKQLDDANQYFSYSEYAGAVKLYEKYLETHPESVNEVQPQIIKCYYNLGVIAIRQWKCDTASDYFRQVLFIDENDKLSKDALALARRCQQAGTSDVEIRKAVTFMEMRK